MKKITIIIGSVILLAITIFFILNKGFTGNAVQDSNVKEFTINAFQFGYTPDTITVNQGDKVKIIINNKDVLHGIRIPELEIRGDETLEFNADKTGEFIWYCANMCGNKHMQMQGKLIVK